MEKIKYICKKCQKAYEVNALWQDVKPKKCLTRKCNTDFKQNPDMLETILPAKKEEKPKNKKKHEK